MPPRFPSTSGAMESEVRNQRVVFGWALPVSLVVHLLIAALVIFGLPVSLSLPEKEQAVAVELVPPPKPSEEPAAEPPPPPPEHPKAEKPPEPDVEAPPAAKNEAAQQSPVPTIKPVVEFGEKDEGPRQTLDGDSAEDGAEAPTAMQEPEKQDLAELLAAAELEQENPATQPAMPETSAPEPAAPETPAAKLEAPPEAQKPLKLEKAKKLFSRAATGDAKATSAMGNVPRPVRAGQLCLTELRAQLINGSPPYFPDLLPSEFRNDGKTVDIPKTAFRASGQWYNLGYRCVVDADALKVVSFAFRVGEAVPRSDWERRGLPAQ